MAKSFDGDGDDDPMVAKYYYHNAKLATGISAGVFVLPDVKDGDTKVLTPVCCAFSVLTISFSSSR